MNNPIHYNPKPNGPLDSLNAIDDPPALNDRCEYYKTTLVPGGGTYGRCTRHYEDCKGTHCGLNGRKDHCIYYEGVKAAGRKVPTAKDLSGT